MSRFFRVKGEPLSRLWLHNITVTRRNGSFKCYCVCGKQSRWLTQEGAQAWTRDHAQIKEKKERTPLYP